jgi:hypothetical protein
MYDCIVLYDGYNLIDTVEQIIDIKYPICMITFKECQKYTKVYKYRFQNIDAKGELLWMYKTDNIDSIDIIHGPESIIRSY